jgi:hypothetical protein
MPLHDHPYSDVNIIYSVVQTGERTTHRGTNSAPNIKRLCNGEYGPEVRLWRYYRNPDRNTWISFLPHLLRVLLLEKRILPGIMVVDKFLFCLFMPLHDHPYSDVNIIYSVVQTGERTTDQGTNSAPNIKRLCIGEYRPGQLYILSSRVAPDITDA